MSNRVQKRAAVRRSIFSSQLARWTAFAPIIIGFGFAAFSAAGHIVGSEAKATTATPQKIWRASLAPALDSQGDAPLRVTSQYLFDRTTSFEVEASAFNPAPTQASDDRFEQVVRQAALSADKLRHAFRQQTEAPVQVAYAGPAVERFGAAPHKDGPDMSAFVLAYAARDESPAAQALHSLADEEELSKLETETSPDHAATPGEAPIPSARPRLEGPKPEKPTETARESDSDDIEIVKPDRRQPRKPAAREEVAEKPEPRGRSRQRLASTGRNEPGGERGGLGWSFRNIFSGSGGARAGKGVAVYDISAAKVYMPDGSVLAAYSGIGKMANNPKYAHVKMNGPTPPHTYNLKMRERRFHGVEAIRMLPVDGKNKYGRDGFLTHSNLLRGRPNQSHGCVAFKDYNKFLNAFKRGKVSQMVVVASGGRSAATRMASN